VSSARKHTCTRDSHALSHFYVNIPVLRSLFAVQESDTRAVIVGLTCWHCAGVHAVGSLRAAVAVDPRKQSSANGSEGPEGQVA
jgi:hypothetical protein